MESARQRIEELDRELEKRAAWAFSLDRELAELHHQLKERTAWALRLDRELNERTLAHGIDLERLAWARPLDRWFHTPLDHGFRVVRRVFDGLRQIFLKPCS